MSAIASITLADGQATPANKTFDVGSAQMGSSTPAIWYEKTAGMFSGYRALTMLVRRSNGSRSTKVSIRVVDPKLNVDNSVNYSTLCNIEFTLPDQCALSDRKDILAFAKNALANAIIVDAVHNTSPAY